MTLRNISLSFLLLFTLFNVNAQERPEAYVTRALDLMQRNAVHRASLNWPLIYKNTLDSARGKETIKETYPAIRYAIGQLEDSHSKFFPPEMVADYLKRYQEVGLEFPYPVDSMIPLGYAYITLPPIGNMNKLDWELYVKTFYDRITKLDQQNPRLWIIDLRENIGGMFTPMFAAIQPFLDQEQVVGSKDSKGQVNYFKYDKGRVSFGEQVIDSLEIPVPRLKHKNIPLYILTGKKTSSSGEFVVASFVGQKNVTIAGRTTQGLTSDNSEFRLSDGAFLVLTTGTLVDRNRTAYSEIGKGISPSLVMNTDQLDEIVFLIGNSR